MGDNTVVEKKLKKHKVPIIKDIIALTKVAEPLELKTIRRRLFLRAEQLAANCCVGKASFKLWRYLEKQFQEVKLNCILEIKANSLRVCCEGPIMVVYPHGVWYRPATLEVETAHSSKTPLIGNKEVG
jgi:hypothetical protein